LVLPSALFPSGFPTQTLNTPLLSPIRATRPAHLILDLFTTVECIRIYTTVTALRVQRHNSLAVFKFTIVRNVDSCTVEHSLPETLVIRIALALWVPKTNLP
jgi:hypothetical protein